MKCTYCGAAIPEGKLVCPVCGREVRIVPDYNPLEDSLSEEMKESLKGATRPIKKDDIRRYRGAIPKESTHSTRVMDRARIDAMRAKRIREIQEMRRREKAKQIREAKKRRKRILLSASLCVALMGAVSLFLGLTSYNARIERGNKALLKTNYAKAQNCFEKALAKDDKRPEAYQGLAELYLKQDDLEKAESVLLTALSSQPANGELYQAAAEFYVKTGQLEKIPKLLEDCDYENVLASLTKYISKEPEYSLPEGTYHEVQEVALSSDSGTVYFTTDGSDPGINAKKYDIPILLEEEGTVEIKAVSFNESGIPSLITSKKYTIELPLEDAPFVSPSTGQYETDTKITIDVPEGYTAYYTMDNTDPSDLTSHAIHYTEPVDMPEGQTIFSAVLLNNRTGKYTRVTKRNYLLEYAK